MGDTYCMFTPEGDRAVEVLVSNVEAELQVRYMDGKSYIPTQEEAYQQVRNYMADVAEKHGEVYDTEPQELIAEALSTTWNDLYGQPCDRWAI